MPKIYTYYYPDYKTGKPVAIKAKSQTEARKQAATLGLPTTEVLPTWKGAPTTTLPQQEKIAQIRKQIEEATAQAQKIQEQLGILKEAKEKGLEITPKTTVEQAQQFLKEFRPPTITDIEATIGELEATKSAQKIQSGSFIVDNFIVQQLTDITNRQKRLEEEQKSFWETIKQGLGFSREEFFRRAQEEAGLSQLKAQAETTLSQITSLREQINRVQAERDEALALSEARLAPMAFIRGEQARIQERYQRELSRLNAQLGTQVALYQAQTGQIEEARRWIDDIVEAATWDAQFRWQQLETMTTLNQREISELGEEYRDWINTLITLARLNYEEERENWRFTLEQAIENPGAGIVPGSDTPEEVAEKVMKFKAQPLELEERTVGGFRVLVDPRTGRVVSTREIGEEGVPTVPFSITALRAGLVGLTQQQAIDLIQSETYTDDFRKQVEEQYQMSLTPDFLQSLWKERREAVLEAIGGTSRPGSFQEFLEEFAE